jgi:hypothetical protein
MFFSQLAKARLEESARNAPIRFTFDWLEGDGL